MPIQRWIYTIPLRIRSLLHRRQVETELDEEIRFHLEQQAARYMSQGPDSNEARYAALRDFGGPGQQKELCRDARKTLWVENIVRDIRFALRTISRNKLFALMALLAFSFGIGSTTTVFSVIDAVLLRPASFSNPATLVQIQAAERKQAWDNVSPRMFHALRARDDLFRQIAAARRSLFTVTRVATPDQVFGYLLTPNFFSFLNAHPLMGRTLNAGDERPGAPSVVLLSYQAWRHLFLADPAAVGKVAEIDGEPHTVIGVMPQSFVMPRFDSMLWTPLRLTAAESAAPDAHALEVVARLQPSISMASAQTALTAVASNFAATVGHNHPGIQLRVAALHDTSGNAYRTTLWLALGMVLGLSVIGCANLSNLLLARGISRRRDYAIRLATGASRTQLIRQALTEVFLLAGVALIVSCAASEIALTYIRDHLAALPIVIPNLSRIQLNGHIFLFSFAVSLVAALLSGLLPSIWSTSIDLSTGLRDAGAYAATGIRVRRLMHLLIGIEVAVSMLLLLTSSLLVKSLVRLVSEDHGIRPAHVLTMRLPSGSWQADVVQRTPEEGRRQSRRYLEMLRHIESIRGVEVAALASSLPLSHVSVRTRLHAPQDAASADVPLIMPRTQAVTGNYFRIMGISLLAGRTFDKHDGDSKLPVALVNEAFVRSYFRGENPVGKTLRSPDASQPIQITGVVQDSTQLDYSEVAEPEVYKNFAQTVQTPFLTAIVLRSYDDPERLSGIIRETLSLKSPTQAVVEIQTLQTLVDNNIWLPRFSAWLFSAFASIALALAGIGIYGVVAYITALREHDFGIRLALGAGPLDVFRTATLQSLTPVLAGAAIGMAGAFMAGRYIAALLYKTSPFDAAASIESAAILLVLAFVAVAGPALRASKIDPAVTLRWE